MPSEPRFIPVVLLIAPSAAPNSVCDWPGNRIGNKSEERPDQVDETGRKIRRSALMFALLTFTFAVAVSGPG